MANDIQAIEPGDVLPLLGAGPDGPLVFFCQTEATEDEPVQAENDLLSIES